MEVVIGDRKIQGRNQGFLLSVFFMEHKEIFMPSLQKMPLIQLSIH